MRAVFIAGPAVTDQSGAADSPSDAVPSIASSSQATRKPKNRLATYRAIVSSSPKGSATACGLEPAQTVDKALPDKKPLSGGQPEAAVQDLKIVDAFLHT